MSETAGKKKPRRNAKGRGGGRGLPERGEDEERCPEARRFVQGQPSTPHRAFDKFNESVDNVNIEDIRDIQPEEYSILYSGTSRGIAELNPDVVSGDVASDGAAHRTASAQDATDGSHETERKERHGAAVDDAVDEAELVRELDACEAECEGDQQESLAGTADHEPDRLSADRYFYGPTQFSSNRRRGLLSSLRYCSSGPLPESCGDRSSVEVAEALLLGVLGDWGIGQSQRAADDLHKVPLRESPEGGASGPASVGGGLSGVLGYVLHTLLTLYYRLFVHLPLLVLHWLASHLWSATTSITALAYVVVSACLSGIVWACLLPLRTAQHLLAWLWQHSLVLAVDFLNQAPSAFGDVRNGPGPHKQAVPTALNGHVHKH